MSYHDYRIGENGPLDRKVKQIIYRSDNCMVYMDEDEVIQWSTNGITLHEEFGDIQNKISLWEVTCNKIFSKKDAYEFKTLLSEAYARIIEENNDRHANQIIERTVYQIEKRGKEVLKQSYILSSFFWTLIVVILLFTLVMIRPYILDSYENKYQIITTSLFGGIGAFVFATIRLKNYSPEIVLTREIHRVDGALRVFYGIIAGLTIAVCIKSNLLFGFIDKLDKTIYLNSFLGIIAGASEVLIPNLIKQVEEKNG